MDVVSEDVGVFSISNGGSLACFDCNFYATKSSPQGMREAFEEISIQTWDVTWNQSYLNSRLSTQYNRYAGVIYAVNTYFAGA